MATLQKFKLLATQCAVAASPTRSPSASPVIHLRRRKTLRMLLWRGGTGGSSSRRRQLPPQHQAEPTDRRGRNSPEDGKEMSASNKLKDLFVSSPPAIGERLSENVRQVLLPPSSGELRRSFPRPLSATLRQRLLRRVWRPVLVGIPE